MKFKTEPGAKHPTTFSAFHAVRLRTPQGGDNVTFPAGTRGVILDLYGDGSYGVEFSAPAEDVLIVAGEDLETA